MSKRTTLSSQAALAIAVGGAIISQANGVWAQNSPTLAPVRPTQVANTVTPTAALPVSPFTVENVVVTLSGTTGFARDTALEQAARQSLPGVLTRTLGLTTVEAQAKVKNLGDTLRFVSQYNIVKESVVPTYQLTTNLTFNESMLRTNFGQKITTISTTITYKTTSSTAEPEATNLQAPVAGQVYRVVVNDATAAGQDRARRLLNALPETTAIYETITTQSITLKLTTTQPETALNTALAGFSFTIAPVLNESPTPVPTTVTLAPSTGAPLPEATQPTAQPNTTTPAPTPRPKPTRPAWLPDFW
jgi:hypothetical protein